MTGQQMRLMIPGPVDVEDDVLEAMAGPVLPHYGQEWLEIYDETVGHMQQVFGTKNDLFLVPGPGTAGLEAAIGSLAYTGEKILVASNGFFGQRLAKVAGTYGLDVAHVQFAQGESVDPEAIRSRLHAEPGIQAIVVVHLETSTGVLNPLRDISAVAAEFDVPLVVDAVSSLGGVPLPVDEWGVDVCVTVSNKCLACPPGIAPLSVSQRAWQQIDRKAGRNHGWYLNLSTWKEYAVDWASWHPYPTSLPTSIVMALRTSLRRILDGGLEAYYQRHVQAAAAVRAALLPLGFRIFTPEAYTSPLITAMYGPPGIDVEALRRYLVDEWQIMISGGLEELHGKILRVGHIGKAASVEYVDLFCQAVAAYPPLRTGR